MFARDVLTVDKACLDRPSAPRCPLSINSGHPALKLQFPLYPRKRTCLYAAAGRCARRKERICRTVSGIRSFGSFHGNMLTSAFGASIAASIATA
jgi:hypothetical protein